MKERPLGEVASKIYLYSYPYKNGILRFQLMKDHIYGYSHIKSWNRVLKNEKLVERNYIDYWKVPDVGTKQKKWMVRAKPDPLIQVIEKQYKLDDFDRYIIKRIFESDLFRKAIETSIKKAKNKGEEIRDPINHMLSIFDIILIINEKILYVLRQLGLNINFKDIESYDIFCDTYLPLIKEIMIDLLKGKTFKEFQFKKGAKDFALSIQDIMVVFIPERTYRKINKGVTFIGAFYSNFKQVFLKLEKMPNQAKKVIEKEKPRLIKKYKKRI
jgi:hypothetical protein